jgi:hypothetical protein
MYTGGLKKVLASFEYLPRLADEGKYRMTNGILYKRSPADNSPEMTIEFGGHLFINNDTNNVNNYHQDIERISPETAAAWLALLTKRVMEIEQEGTKYLFVIAPDKQTVFRHLLPETYR